MHCNTVQISPMLLSLTLLEANTASHTQATTRMETRLHFHQSALLCSSRLPSSRRRQAGSDSVRPFKSRQTGWSITFSCFFLNYPSPLSYPHLSPVESSSSAGCQMKPVKVLGDSGSRGPLSGRLAHSFWFLFCPLSVQCCAGGQHGSRWHSKSSSCLKVCLLHRN